MSLRPPPEPDEPADQTVHCVDDYLSGLNTQAITLYLGRHRRAYVIEASDLAAVMRVIIARSPRVQLRYLHRRLPGVGVRNTLTPQCVQGLANRVAAALGRQYDIFDE